MLKTLRTLLAAAGLMNAPAANATDPGSTRDTVLDFSEAFLTPEATARLKSPFETGYEAFELLDINTGTADAEQLPDTAWGEILLHELLGFSDRALWLDWKYNVLTLVNDDDWDNQLGQLFELYNLAPLAEEERSAILEKARDLHGDHPKVMMFPDLQPLAEKRGYRLMIFENRSDGLGLFALPKEDAAAWHLTRLGDVLIIDAAAGAIPDPRAGGKVIQLTN